MRGRRSRTAATILTLGLLALPRAGAGQEAPDRLSLEQAIELAVVNNPDFRARLNDEGVADWAVRSAYASFLPTASVGGGISYQEGGSARIGGFTADDIGLSATPDYYYSSFDVTLRLGLDGADFHRIDREKASRRSVVASVVAAEQTLEATVTRQYLAVLRTRDAVALAEAELERARGNLALAEARFEVESASGIEAKQAQVELGRAEVALLRSEQSLANQKIRLLELMGVTPTADVELTSDLPVFDPPWTLASLLDAALASQPQLEVASASLESAQAGVGIARASYWPTLSLSTGLSGFTRRASSDQYLLDQALAGQQQGCQFENQLIQLVNALDQSLDLSEKDCSGIQLSDERRSDILAQNDRFPFDFTNEPLSLTLGVSLPIFQGLARQQQVEAARAQAEDARWQLRAREIQTRADVETAFRDLETAYEAVQLEERNRELARDQLRLARERYRVGAAPFIELLEAEALMARADREYLLGVYTFQESLTVLEQAIGQKLALPESE